MAVGAVERYRLEFRPRAALAPQRKPGTLRSLPRALSFAAAAAILSAAILFAIWRAPSLPADAPPVSRLALAVIVGVVLTEVHKRVRGSRAVGTSLARAQTLLCVAGALTMILIDNSVARAFGIAGAASIVRFRTPVDDPTDATVLFLSMALGMASGVGAFALSIAGAAGVCLLLIAFGTIAPEPNRRTVTIEMVADGHEFPASHVRGVLARHAVAFEPSEWSQDGATRIKYRATVDDSVSLEALGAELMNRGRAGLQSVTWELRKNCA